MCHTMRDSCGDAVTVSVASFPSYIYMDRLRIYTRGRYELSVQYSVYHVCLLYLVRRS